MPLPPCVDNESVSVILEVVVCEGAKLRRCGVAPFSFGGVTMEDQRAPLHFHRNDESRTTQPGRGGRLQSPADERGPYETTYTITLGYPEREIVTQ